jgi:hypothetical protein
VGVVVAVGWNGTGVATGALTTGTEVALSLPVSPDTVHASAPIPRSTITHTRDLFIKRIPFKL